MLFCKLDHGLRQFMLTSPVHHRHHHGGQWQWERGESDQRVQAGDQVIIIVIIINITNICCQTTRAHRQGAEGSPRLRGDLRVRQPRPGGLRVWHRVRRLHPTRHLQPPPQVRCQPGSYSCFLGNISDIMVSIFPFISLVLSRIISHENRICVQNL